MNLRISEMPELSALEDSDYLVLQRKSGSNKQSYKISFADFKTQFLNNFNVVSVKSAASCDIAQFAPFAHGHDYSDFWYFSSYGPDSFNRDSNNRSALCCIYNGKFNVVKYLPGINQKSVHSISAWQPPSIEKIIDETGSYGMSYLYKPGDIQLLAVKDFMSYLTAYRHYEISENNININSSTFDGFVIPNGETFNCATTAFKSACRLYSTSKTENATSFTVPDINDIFVKCDPGLPASQMQPLQTVNYSNVLVQHDHGGKLTRGSNDNIELELNNVVFSVRPTKNGDKSKDQYKNAIHHGYETSEDAPMISYDEYEKYKPGIKEINLTCDVSISECTESGDDEQSYPEYRHVQALLYIGKSNE